MIGALQNAQGEHLDFVFSSGAERRDEVVVLGHGVTANKDRSWAQSLAAGLDQAGFACLRFSFSGNGRSQGEFGESTVTKEVADLGAVLDALTGFRRVIFAGHSMGGAVGVLRAASDERLSALISLAGMVHVEDFAARKFGDLKPGVDTMWEKPECPLSQTFMDDMKALHSVVERGAEVRVPWLLVHGTEDTVVPLKDSQDIVAKAVVDPKLVVIEGADHLFSGEAEGVMVKAVVDWLTAQ